VKQKCQQVKQKRIQQTQATAARATRHTSNATVPNASMLPLPPPQVKQKRTDTTQYYSQSNAAPERLATPFCTPDCLLTPVSPRAVGKKISSKKSFKYFCQQPLGIPVFSALGGRTGPKHNCFMAFNIYIDLYIYIYLYSYDLQKRLRNKSEGRRHGRKGRSHKSVPHKSAYT